MEGATNDGPCAVRPDQEVALGGVAGCGSDCNPVRVRREPGDFAPERDRVEAGGLEQRAVERRAQRHDHRTAEHVVGRRQLEALQDRAVHAAKLAPRRGEAPGQNDVRDAQPPERGDRVRRDTQPEAELARRCRALEQPNVPAGLPQRDRGRQSADAGAGDQSGALHCRCIRELPRRGAQPR